MTTAATSHSGLDPRAALGSLLAHGLLFGAVAAAATLGGVAAPPSERAIELIEIAIAAPIEAPVAAPIEAPVVTQAAAPAPVIEPVALDVSPPVPEPPAPEPPVPEPIVDQIAELPEPPPPVAKPAPKPRPKPVAQKSVDAPPPAAVQAPEPVQAAAPTPAPIVAAPLPSAAPEAVPQAAAVAAPAANEIMVTTDARFRARPAAPEYPPRARQMGVEGTTVLRALVGETGDTLELIVWQGSGMRLLDEAALAAARQWRFEPARRGDRLLTAWVEVPVRFILR